MVFSKADKVKIVTFAVVAYGLPWLFVPWMRPEGTGDIMTAYDNLGTYMMILPTFGIVLGRIICERKVRGLLQWLYLAAFTAGTAVMVLCAAKVMPGNAGDNMATVFMGLSVVLFIGSCLDGKELYPFKNIKKFIGIYLVFVVIRQIDNLPLIMQAGALPTAGVIASELLMLVPFSNFAFNSMFFFGEEYAWRGCLQGRMQDIFGKRRGVILLGIIWELWHMPLWVMIYGPDQWKSIVMLESVRMLDVVGLAVFLGWAYMKTKNIWCCVLLHGVNNASGAAFDWIANGNTAENINPFDLSTASTSEYILLFISTGIMLAFLFAKEYRKEGKV